MQFDSHIWSLLETTVRLVNTVTPGREGGRDVVAPEGAEQVKAVARALSGAGRAPSLDPAQAQALVEVGAAARVVFDQVAAGHLDAAAEQVNALLSRTRARPRLDRFPDSGWSLHFHGRDDTLAVGWAAGIASGLALALGSDLAGRLGVCAAPACDRVYVDTSRNSGRRFCSTRCQSRVKAAVHRARSTAAD